MDRYTAFHYSSNCGVAVYSPILWILYKWTGLPLDVQLDEGRASEFRTFISRVDREFGTTGYATVTKALSLTINAACSLIATGILSPNNAVRAHATLARSPNQSIALCSAD